MAAILGKKLGMTQIFTDEGDRVVVTVIEAGPCAVTQVKTNARDGYQAVQIGFGDVKKGKLNKPAAGHFKKAGVDARRHLAEIRVDVETAEGASEEEAILKLVVPEMPEAAVEEPAEEEAVEEPAAEEPAAEAETEAAGEAKAEDAGAGEEEKTTAAEGEEAEAAEAEAEEPKAEEKKTRKGKGRKKAKPEVKKPEITVSAFEQGQRVKVTGVSKGKGFAGVMKRHNFKGGPGSHGAHFHRAPGSIGASAYPSRVFKGLRLPGQMGNRKSTQLGLTVVDIDAEKNLLFLKGAVPGSNNGIVFIQTN